MHRCSQFAPRTRCVQGHELQMKPWGPGPDIDVGRCGVQVFICQGGVAGWGASPRSPGYWGTGVYILKYIWGNYGRVGYSLIRLVTGRVILIFGRICPPGQGRDGQVYGQMLGARCRPSDKVPHKVVVQGGHTRSFGTDLAQGYQIFRCTRFWTRLPRSCGR